MNKDDRDRQPNAGIFGFDETSKEVLSAPESRNEVDESVSPTNSVGVRSPEFRGTFREDFNAFIDDLGLSHFSSSEFLALGGSHHGGGTCSGKNGVPPRGLWQNISNTARVLDALRDELGSPITLNSVYRNESYNTCIGGAQFSQHKRFNAADFHCRDVGPRDCARALFRLRAEGDGVFGVGLGIGIYPSFVHVDTRGSNEEWAGSGASLGGLI